MTDNRNIHHRRTIRLKGYDYSQPGAYFVTICAHNRECLFGAIANGKMAANKYGMIAHEYWNSIPDHFPDVELDEYVVMPNHIHGIVVIKTDVGAIHELPLHNVSIQNIKYRRNMLIPKIVGKFKMNTAKQINILHNSHGAVWQRNYYEHIIRNETELNKIREYIHNNPINWESDDYYMNSRNKV